MYLLNHRLDLSSLTILFIHFSCPTSASDPYAIWVYPAWGPNPTTTLNYLDTINVSWKSNYPNPYLARWCETDARIWTLCSDDPVNSTGTLPLKLDGGNMTQSCGPNVGCHLELHVPASTATAYGSNSDPLHVTSNAAALPTTWSAQPSSPATTSQTPTPTTEPATAASSSSSTAHHPAPVNTTAPSPSTSSAPPTSTTLSPAAKAGIALGAIFSSALLALLALLTYRLRQQRGNAPPNLPELGKGGSDSFLGGRGSQQQQQMEIGELEPGMVGELGDTWLRELEPGQTWVWELEGVPVGGDRVGRRG